MKKKLLSILFFTLTWLLISIPLAYAEYGDFRQVETSGLSGFALDYANGINSGLSSDEAMSRASVTSTSTNSGSGSSSSSSGSSSGSSDGGKWYIPDWVEKLMAKTETLIGKVEKFVTTAEKIWKKGPLNSIVEWLYSGLDSLADLFINGLGTSIFYITPLSKTPLVKSAWSKVFWITFTFLLIAMLWVIYKMFSGRDSNNGQLTTQTAKSNIIMLGLAFLLSVSSLWIADFGIVLTNQFSGALVNSTLKERADIQDVSKVTGQDSKKLITAMLVPGNVVKSFDSGNVTLTESLRVDENVNIDKIRSKDDANNKSKDIDWGASSVADSIGNVFFVIIAFIPLLILLVFPIVRHLMIFLFAIGAPVWFTISAFGNGKAAIGWAGNYLKTLGVGLIMVVGWAMCVSIMGEDTAAKDTLGSLSSVLGVGKKVLVLAIILAMDYIAIRWTLDMWKNVLSDPLTLGGGAILQGASVALGGISRVAGAISSATDNPWLAHKLDDRAREQGKEASGIGEAIRRVSLATHNWSAKADEWGGKAGEKAIETISSEKNTKWGKEISKDIDKTIKSAEKMGNLKIPGIEKRAGDWFKKGEIQAPDTFKVIKNREVQEESQWSTISIPQGADTDKMMSYLANDVKIPAHAMKQDGKTLRISSRHAEQAVGQLQEWAKDNIKVQAPKESSSVAGANSPNVLLFNQKGDPLIVQSKVDQPAPKTPTFDIVKNVNDMRQWAAISLPVGVDKNDAIRALISEINGTRVLPSHAVKADDDSPYVLRVESKYAEKAVQGLKDWKKNAVQYWTYGAKFVVLKNNLPVTMSSKPVNGMNMGQWQGGH